MVTLIGIIRHGFHFFTYFVPQGAPMWLIPVMIPIEILSYFIRPLSLSVRLFANMVAGHVMLAVIGGFVFALGIWAGWIPLAFVTVLFGLELLIACLQAYVSPSSPASICTTRSTCTELRRSGRHQQRNPIAKKGK